MKTHTVIGRRRAKRGCGETGSARKISGRKQQRADFPALSSEGEHGGGSEFTSIAARARKPIEAGVETDGENPLKSVRTKDDLQAQPIRLWEQHNPHPATGFSSN